MTDDIITLSFLTKRCNGQNIPAFPPLTLVIRSIVYFLQKMVIKTGLHHKVMDIKGYLHGYAALLGIKMHLRAQNSKWPT